MVGVDGVLAAWEFDPLPTIGAGAAGMVYFSAWRRMDARAGGRRRSRPTAFGGGLLTLLIAVNGPPDVLSETSFSAHMVQHLLIVLVSAPLLVLGAPVSLLVRADPPWLPRHVVAGILSTRSVRVLARPAVAFTLFTTVLVGSHLSPFYGLTLEDETAHQLEHAGYLGTALLFWWPAIGTDPGPGKPAHPARALYVLLAMPVMAFLGVAIAGTDHVLYGYYAVHAPQWSASPIEDQHLAGTLMWIGGVLSFPPLLGLIAMRWLDDDERVHRRLTAGPRGPGPIARRHPDKPFTAEGAR